MIVELITLLTLLAGGSALLHLLGLRGWGLPFLGFATGIALYLGIGFVQVLTFLPTSPILTLIVVGGAPVVAWSVALVRREASRPPLRTSLLWTAAAAVATIVIALVARWANLASWSPDTFRYLMSGSLIAQGQYGAASPGLVTKRILGVPLLHSPGNLDGAFYLPAITPLVAIAVLGSLAWFAWTAMRSTAPPRLLLGAILLGLAMLVTVNRFVFHAFYINGNMLFALLMLVIVGSCWLLLRGTRADEHALKVMVLVALPALVITRAEGSLVIALAMLPILLSDRTSPRFSAQVLAVLGVSAFAWEARVIAAYVGGGEPPPFSAVALLVYGVALIAAIPLLRWKALQKRARLALWGVLGVMWVALGVLALRDRDVLIDSVRATARNLVFGDGSWGLSAVLIAGLAAIAIIAFRFDGDRQVSFVLAAFVPLALLLAYFRGIAYRVGDGDSLNRILIEFAPIAVLLVIAAVAEGTLRWSPGRTRSTVPVPSSE